MSWKKRKIIMFILMFLCATACIMYRPMADGANVTIGLSSGSVSKGDPVTATVSVKGSDLSAYTIYVTYDSSVLQFDSSSGSAQANGSGGSLVISGTSAGTVSLNFTAISNGTSVISTSGTEAYNINLETLPIAHAGVSVRVEPASAATEEEGSNTTEAASEITTEESTEVATESEEEDVAQEQIIIDDIAYHFTEEEAELAIPEGYTSTSVKYSEKKLTAYTSPNGKLKLVCLVDPNNNYIWYIYDEEEEKFTKYNEIMAYPGRYIFMDKPEEVELPEGYEEAIFDINKESITGYQTEELKAENMYLVYAMDISGEEGLYLFDLEKQIFIKYVPVTVTKEVEKRVEVPVTVEKKTESQPVTGSPLFYVVICETIAIILFIFLCILHRAKTRLLREEIRNADEMIAELAKSNGSVNHNILDRMYGEESGAKNHTEQVLAAETKYGEETAREKKRLKDMDEVSRIMSMDGIEELTADEEADDSRTDKPIIDENYDANLDSAFVTEPSGDEKTGED